MTLPQLKQDVYRKIQKAGYSTVNPEIFRQMDPDLSLDDARQQLIAGTDWQVEDQTFTGYWIVRPPQKGVVRRTVDRLTGKSR